MALEGTQEYIDINKIEFDVDNPRIKILMDALEEEYGTKPTVEQIVSALMYTPAFEQLKKSIVANKGILSPIIIKMLDDNAYKCIDGNTRLAIYKTLNNESPNDEFWEKILATTYKNIDHDDECNILVQSNLVQAKPWDPYSRAKYLYELKNRPDWDLEKFSAICGMQATEVQQYIETYEIMEHKAVTNMG